MIKKLFSKNNILIKQISKFVSVGFLNTGIDMGLFALITWIFGIYAGYGATLISVFSFLIANINSFFWNKFWVFREQGRKNAIKEYFKFLATSSVALGINALVVYIMTTLIPPIIVGEQLWAYTAKALAIVISLGFNFLGYKFIVFKK